MDGGILPADECKSTEFLPVPSSTTKICICHTFNTKLNNLCWGKLGISCCSQVRNLGIYMDRYLDMRKHVSKTLHVGNIFQNQQKNV